MADLALDLASLTPPDDHDAVSILAFTHWVRCHLQPEGQDQEDRTAAIAWFTHVFRVAPQDVPSELYSVLAPVADPAGNDLDAWNNEAVKLLSIPQVAGNRHCLDRAIRLLNMAIAAAPIGHAGRTVTLSNLSAALFSRFTRMGVQADLDEAISTARQAIRVMSPHQQDKALALCNLCNALQARFERTGIQDDIEEAVATGRQVVAMTPPQHRDHVRYLTNLGTALRTRFEHGGVVADLDEAVDATRKAVAAASADSSIRASVQSNLSGLLSLRFDRWGALSDLDEAIGTRRQAVAATQACDPNHAAMLSGLGIALRTRFVRRGELSDLDEAVDMARQAVAATPADHPELAGRLSSLGNALHVRFARTGVQADLGDAVEVERRAIAAASPGHPDRGRCLTNLGAAVLTRFERIGARADLDDAIDLTRRAIATTAEGHPERADRLANLAAGLLTRYARVGVPSDLDEAIEVAREAVAGMPLDDLSRIPILSNLGAALRTRFGCTGVQADLDDAVEAGREAVTATPLDDPKRAMYLSNLGSALQIRYGLRGVPSDLDDAVNVGREAVAATPVDHPDRVVMLSNLGEALRVRSGRTTARADLDDAAECFGQGMASETAGPLIRARCGRARAELMARQGRWGEAYQAWQHVLALLPLLVSSDLDRGDRQHHLSFLAGLGPQASLAALHAVGIESAWEVLEAGRGVLIRQALDIRAETVLHAAHPQLAAELEQSRRALNSVPPPRADNEEMAAETSRRRGDALAICERIIAEIRLQPGFQRFGLPPSARELHDATDDGAIVAVVASGDHGNALILSARGVDQIELPDLSEREATDRAIALLTAAHDFTQDAAATVRHVLEWLWDAVTGPVLDHMGHHGRPGSDQAWPRVWWMPTGALSLLPLHAAGHHHGDVEGVDCRSVLDRVVSSYTPTVEILRHARRTRPSTDGPTLIVGINQVPGHRVLTSAVAEANAVHEILAAEPPPLIDAGATRGAVLAALPAARWAHFACHSAPEADPADSHLVLHDGLLTIRELGDRPPHEAYLAYLSACTTAFGGLSLPDEAIHIASAFQLAGFQHVIGTLWPIADHVAPMFAAHIYQRLKDGQSPGLAVHHATQRVRDEHREHPQLWASHLHFGP